MGFFDFLKKPCEEEIDAERRQQLIKNGRVADGFILDCSSDDEGGEIVRYHYTVQGVDFESCDRLSPEQTENLQKYDSGASVSVRFDPKNHHNSIII